jgi:peptide/nickel transport system substrate-binding protein
VIPSWQGRLAVVAHNDVENVQPAIDPLSFVYFSGMRR